MGLVLCNQWSVNADLVDPTDLNECVQETTFGWEVYKIR